MLDTRDLQEKREELKEQILDAFNEEFGTDYSEFEELPLEDNIPDPSEDVDKEQLKEFNQYWAEELVVISQIINLQDEVENYADNDFEDGITLIPEEDFTDYCKELLQDIGDLPTDLPSYIENNMNWDGMAEELKVDYSEVEFQGEDYLYR